MFGLLIFTHELGHFTAAKLFRVKVNQFAIGMGPALAKITRGETTYALRLFPVGGFCAMEGEDEESADDRAFNHKPVWQRMIISVAGAFVNLLTGFLIILVLMSTQPYFASTTVSMFGKGATSSAAGGLKVGDVITRINGSRVHVFQDITYGLALSSDNTADIQVRRSGKTADLKNVAFPMVDNGNGGKMMSYDFFVEPEAKTVGTVLHETVYQTVGMVRFVWMTFVELLRGRFGLKDLAGPIGTTAAVGQAAKAGVGELFSIVALIAVNLGVVNLFPLPALDGGKLCFLLVEAARRKPLDPKYEGAVNFVGFSLLMLLMVVVSYNDIIRLMRG